MLMFGLLMVYRLILHFVLLCLFNLELEVLQSPLGPTSVLAEPNNPNQLTLDYRSYISFFPQAASS